ncbi:MAG: hypothetical protein R6U13_06815 [Desulfatiglandaceae bacterium]
MKTGQSYTFLVELDKMKGIHKVVFHNDGEILEETRVGDDMRVSVRKVDEGG